MFHSPAFAPFLPEKLAFLHAGRLIERMVSGPSPSPAPPVRGADFQDLLVRVGRDRDRAAFVEIFSHYAPRVKSWLLRQGTDEQLAEEVVQSAFVTVWEKAAHYDPARAAPGTWIFTIARNRRIDALRRERFVDYDSGSAALSAARAPSGEPYADAETVEDLGAALDALPPEQEAVLRKAFFEDKSHRAISREMNLPLGTVKSRVRLGMDKLRDLLKGEE